MAQDSSDGLHGEARLIADVDRMVVLMQLMRMLVIEWGRRRARDEKKVTGALNAYRRSVRHVDMPFRNGLNLNHVRIGRRGPETRLPYHATPPKNSPAMHSEQSIEPGDR
ncbi:hypothetical protein MES5069_130092 [Mesorhizobium escarrei]|uniref:Uncharacterized protein n=1 Tax=Mesorhizobium escarrei TaxID=666018 RepID=A0ABN8JFZ2_9HYPH|nr:hypothetical protein MES5069_130092 [Mesorhizobium escarrei]